MNYFFASAVGSNRIAVGNISLTNTAGTVTYAYMAIGANTARNAFFTVPADKNGYITHWQASSGTSSGTHYTQVRILATSHSGILYPGIFLVVDECGVQNNGIGFNYPIALRFPATCDIKIAALSDSVSANANVMGTLFGWYE